MKKAFKLPRIKFFFKKDNGKLNNTLKSTTILVNGVLFTYILASIISGVVDLVFFSGLSKSFYTIFAIYIPASIVMCLLSLVITSGKAWCAIKVEQINALMKALQNKGYTWADRLKGVKRKWSFAHLICASVSIITTISLSIVSIGAGIRTMQQNINNMTKDAEQLIELNNSVNSGVKEKRAAAKSNITGSITAKDVAKTEVDRYYKRLVSYQEEYFALSDEDKAGEKGEAIINKIVKEIPGASKRNALYFTQADLQKSIQSVSTKNETINNAELYEEAVAYDQSQIEVTIKAIADKDYKMPDGTVIQFIDEDGKVINTQLAIARLQNGVSAWQSDTGDVGESSKMFTLLATYFKIPEKAGGMGATEWMIMILICFFGIIQEVLIALLTPKVTINRRTLFDYESYFEADFDEDDFMYYVYRGYLKKGVINTEDFEAKANKCKANKLIPEELSGYENPKLKSKAKAIEPKIQYINKDYDSQELKDISESVKEQLN